jgi:integrase/recombinase XerD
MLATRMSGPLAPFASGFHADLEEQGYTPTGAWQAMQLASLVSEWMVAAGMELHELTSEAVNGFLAQRRMQGHKHWVSPAAMAPLMSYLRRQGAVSEPSPVGPKGTGRDHLLEEYRTYLVAERGLSSSTVDMYVHTARVFVSEQPKCGDGDFKEPGVSDIVAFVARQSRQRAAASGKVVVSGTRAYLRFLHVMGRISKPLHQAVPAVAQWRLNTLPKALEPNQVKRLLENCDQSTMMGRRNLAILTTLVRLGLRAGEVAALQLSDLDWRSGEITIHGKAGRTDRLPLPADVGQVIVAWLTQGRPANKAPQVFTSLRAPHRGLTRQAVSRLVQRACIRSGLPSVHVHCLRHTAASQMLQAGADLNEIGQVLRHHNLQTTAIYAKVDRSSLAGLVRPWPGDAR